MLGLGIFPGIAPIAVIPVVLLLLIAEQDVIDATTMIGDLPE